MMTRVPPSEPTILLMVTSSIFLLRQFLVSSWSFSHCESDHILASRQMFYMFFSRQNILCGTSNYGLYQSPASIRGPAVGWRPRGNCRLRNKFSAKACRGSRFDGSVPAASEPPSDALGSTVLGAYVRCLLTYWKCNKDPTVTASEFPRQSPQTTPR